MNRLFDSEQIRARASGAVVAAIADQRDCEPITCTRRIADCRIAGRTVAEWQRQWLLNGGFAVDSAAAAPLTGGLALREDSWVSADMLARLRRANGPLLLLDSEGIPLCRRGDAQGAERLEADQGSLRIRYPWDLLRLSEILLGTFSEDRVEGELHASVVHQGTLQVGRGTRILPGVFIEGAVCIGEHCTIGPNCYIRGSTSIGNNCRIGQSVEVKNSLIMDNTCIGHLSYCGDSVLGSEVNWGAGTVVANLRHDGKNQRSMVNGRLQDTGRRKFGCIMGDGVHTGIHTSIYPGRKLWPLSTTRPARVVQRDIHPDSGEMVPGVGFEPTL